MTAAGDCYGFAVEEANRLLDKPGAVIVHGTVIHPWTKAPFQHAWVEVDGTAYDWQMIHVRGQEPIPVAAYREIWKPRAMTRYTPQQVLACALRERHMGPWTRRTPAKKSKSR